MSGYQLRSASPPSEHRSSSQESESDPEWARLEFAKKDSAALPAEHQATALEKVAASAGSEAYPALGSAESVDQSASTELFAYRLVSKESFAHAARCPRRLDRARLPA